MLAQHAVLLLNVLDDDVSCSVPATHIKIAIHPKLKGEIRKLFPRFGISERTLFPDLPGFAGSHGQARNFDRDPDIRPYLSRHMQALQGERWEEVQNQMYAIRKKAARAAQADRGDSSYVIVEFEAEDRVDREAINRLRLEGFCEPTKGGLEVPKDKALEVVAPPEE
jgi:hypothetical protein